LCSHSLARVWQVLIVSVLLLHQGPRNQSISVTISSTVRDLVLLRTIETSICVFGSCETKKERKLQRVVVITILILGCCCLTAFKNMSDLWFIHVRCNGTSVPGVIQSFVEQWPESVKVIDPSTGSLPLHMACQFSASLELIQYLVEQWPESVQAINHQSGNLPLHYACRNVASFEVIQYLVAQWPKSVQVISYRSGNLPLHHACDYIKSLEIIQCLVAQWPESVKHRNSDGKTPWDITYGQYGRIVVLNWLQLPWRDRFN
jgi:hypothetical protein